MAKDMTYKEAFDELEKIVASLENDSHEIDKLADRIKRANELVNFCKEKLRNIEDEVNSEIKKDENL